MRSPWKSVAPLEPDREYVALATHIPTRRLASTWKMFRGAHSVRRQLEATDGIVGFSLLAEPFGRNYATLSVWRDQTALEAFTNAAPHAALMPGLRSDMAQTSFETWTISGSDGIPSWSDALTRLRRA